MLDRRLSNRKSIDYNIEMYLTRVYGGQEIVDVVFEVEQVDKRVVVQRERLEYVVLPVLKL